LIVLLLRGTPAEINTYQPVDAAQTQAITQEATLLIRTALSEPQPFPWAGEHYQFPRVAVWPRPLQQPCPPLYFSGNSLNSALFAARERLGVCLSFHRPEVVADTVARYRAAAASSGWEPTADHIVYRGLVVVADTAQRAAELEAAFLPPRVRYVLHGPTPGLSRPTDGDGQQAAVDAGFGLGRMLFAGTPEMLVERIRAFQAITGVGVLDLIFSWGQTAAADVQRSIELFGREVLPRVRDLTPAAQPAAAGASSGS
jgi:alkanesulfonate monooxygenase SsuD/methylene tetrahydromethanopterin reductase-like flavin-dependent oxidoreductase (luciferase family)